MTSTPGCSILSGSGRVVSLRAQPLSGSRSPRVTAEGRRAPALRFGDPRVMALLGALCVSLNAVGFTSRSLRAQVSRPARRRLHPQPDELRPGPATPQRTDRTHRGHQHLPAHPGRATGRRSSTPRSTTGSCDHYWPPISHQPPPNSAPLYAPSTARPRLHRRRTPGKRRLKTQDQRQSLEHQAGATLRPGLRPEGVALRAVRLTGRGEPGTFGAWLMISPSGTGIC